MAGDGGSDFVIVDHEITPSQSRAIEQTVGTQRSATAKNRYSIEPHH